MSTAIGDLVATLGMDTSGWDSAISGAKGKLGGFAGSIAGILKGLGTEALGFDPTSLKGWVDALFDAAERMRTAKSEADKLNVSLQRYLQLEAAAKAGGESMPVLAMGMRQFEMGISKAMRGGEQADALRQIGLSAADLSSMTPDEAIQKLAVALQKVKSPAERFRLEMDLMGRAGANLDKVLQKLSDDTRDAGPSPAAAENLARFGKGWNDFKKTVGRGKDEILGAFAGALMNTGGVDAAGIIERREAAEKAASDREAQRAAQRASDAKGLLSDAQQIARSLTETPDPFRDIAESLRGLGKEGDAALAKLRDLRAEVGRHRAAEALEKISAPIDKLLSAEVRNLPNDMAHQRLREIQNAGGTLGQQREAARLGELEDSTLPTVERLQSAIKSMTEQTRSWGSETSHVAQVMAMIDSGAHESWIGVRRQQALDLAKTLDKLELQKKVKGEIAELTKGPLDDLQKKLADLKKAKSEDLIDNAQYARGIEALKRRAEEARPEGPSELPKAQQYGSQEAWSTIVHAMYGRGDDKKHQQQIAENTKAANELLKDIAQAEKELYAIP